MLSLPQGSTFPPNNFMSPSVFPHMLDCLSAFYALVRCRTRVVKIHFPNDLVLELKISSAVPKGKANIIDDVFNRLSMGSTSHVEEGKTKLVKKVHRLACLGVYLLNSSEGGVVVMNEDDSSLVSQVKKKYNKNPILIELKANVHK
ncbi:hypothetical protein MTR67_002951 [Solanum verrucosum]|uniref:Uncharacterized protein n=1 Tax=Solanum verrucosum TaxID=315347 RepID=A0AAF0PVU3_SOLVR|nr:hypothetical protein MTR67_002951 [Solanum verrucosum]